MALRSGTRGGLHPLPLTPSLVRAQEPTREKSGHDLHRHQHRRTGRISPRHIRTEDQ